MGSESGGGGWAEGWRSGCVPGEGIASGEKNGMKGEEVVESGGSSRSVGNYDDGGDFWSCDDHDGIRHCRTGRRGFGDIRGWLVVKGR